MIEYGNEVAAGRVQKVSSQTKFGRLTNATNGSDVWEGGGPYTGHPTGSPETIEIFSTSSEDTATGPGMRTARIWGLLSSTAATETYEDLSLSGTSGVTSTGEWYRVYRLKGLTYGTDAQNNGTITVRHTTTTANVFAQVQAGFGQTQITAWTVPMGSTAYINQAYITAVKADGTACGANISIRVREQDQGGYNAIRIYTVTNTYPIKPPLIFPIILPEGADIKVTVDVVSTASIQVSAELDITIEDRRAPRR